MESVRQRRLISAIGTGLAAAALIASPVASARGPSPYLPLSMSPQIERQIERVLILAGKPVMRRPIAAAVVLEALPAACERDRPLCEEVRRYLDRFTQKHAVTSVRPKVAATVGDSSATQPNQHGEPVDAVWQISASGYYQPSDWLIINAGGVAYDGNATATGTFISTGFHFAQLDIGFRDHWWSPHTDSASIITTEAPTMPSITLSNYEPLTPIGINYEVFYAEMSSQNGIRYNGGTTSGKPRLAGFHIGIEPVPGYAVSLSRISQYGGGARSTSAFSQFVDELLQTSNRNDASGEAEESNRIASLGSSMLFPGKVPFAARVEYAGEDNTYEGKHRLGATNLTFGLDFPMLWNAWDATFEISEWQNDWYVHPLYPRGFTNRGHVLGHWFGDNRIFNDDISGNSQMLRVGRQLSSGDYVRATYRHLAYDVDRVDVGAQRPYDSLHTLGISYVTAVAGYEVEAELQVGQDVFGESYARLGASFDLALARSRSSVVPDTQGDTSSTTEVFVDVGGQYTRAREYLLLQFRQRDTTSFEPSFHVGVGARRRVSDRSDLGVRLEADQVNGYNLLSVRALDYRFRINQKFAAGAFFGAGRYDIKLPAYGYYLGAGVQYRDLLPGWDVGLDYRQYDKLTRDKGLPSDPQSNPGLPRRVIDINGISLYMSKRW